MKNLLLSTLLVCASNLMAAPFIIDFTTTNISGNTYRYEYRVSGGPLTNDPAFLEIVFPYQLFDNLTNGSPASPGTDILPPIVDFLSDGLFILNLSAGTTYDLEPFSVEADLIGQSLPASQVFRVYSGTLYDEEFEFDLPVEVQDGQTVARVVVNPDPTDEIPEPSTYFLIATGIGALLLRRHNN